MISKVFTLGTFLVFLTLSCVYANSCENLLKTSTDEDNLIQLMEKDMFNLKDESNKCIETLLRSGNFKALEFFLNEISKRGIRFRETLSVSINNIQKRLEDLHNKFRFDENDFQKVAPAFQWAQSMDNIFLEIKFAHRHDSPGCLEVKNERVEVHKNLFVFSGHCVIGDVPIKFHLNLELWQEVSSKDIVQGFGSVGRYQVTLKKDVSGMYWDRLLKNGFEQPSNMRVWFEMKSKYADQLQTYEDDDEEMEFKRQVEEIEKNAKEKKKRKPKAEKPAKEKDPLEMKSERISEL